MKSPPPITAAKLKFGPDYIIPSPFDPRLIWYIPPFVAQAAMDTGVARKPIADMDAYRPSCASASIRRPPSCRRFRASRSCGEPNKRIVFAEGEEKSVIRAAYAFQARPGHGDPVRPRGAGAARTPPRPV
jgi:malate dehydrogenase (oxaloacetate-decarboxylating)(NADP+)